MASPGNNSELLLLILLLQSLSEEDDPFFGREIYERLRRRLKHSELFDPEIDHLLERRFRYPGRYRDRRLSEAREVATSVLEGFRRSGYPLGGYRRRYQRRGNAVWLSGSSSNEISKTGSLTIARHLALWNRFQ